MNYNHFHHLFDPMRRVASMHRKASVRDQWLADVFTTAMEGGINYWASVSNFHWLNADGSEDLSGFSATIHDEEQGGTYIVDRKVIAKGMSLAQSAPVYWSTERPPLVFTEDSDWDYDASDADMIVQLGLFGEVVYG